MSQQATNNNNNHDGDHVALEQHVQDLRERGNYQFSITEYETAANLYTSAIHVLLEAVEEGEEGQEQDADAGGDLLENNNNNNHNVIVNQQDVDVKLAAFLESCRDNSGQGQPPQQQSDVATADTSGGGASYAYETILVLLCNRSACAYQMKEYDEALRDAELAWSSSAVPAVPAPSTTAANTTSTATTTTTTTTTMAMTMNRLKAGYRLAKTQLALKRYTATKETCQRAIRIIDDAAAATATAAATAATTSKTGEVTPAAAKDVVATTKEAGAEDDENDDDDDETAANLRQEFQHEHQMEQQRKGFTEIYQQAVEGALVEDKATPSTASGGGAAAATATAETSIRYADRAVSIKEFARDKSAKGKECLGYGNFSEIVVVRHKQTREKFALKIIEKKRAAELAKRQHPNVYNEIQMERRVLLERLVDGTASKLSPHPNIVTMYHAFQDYNTIYYLMELYDQWGDLWSELRYKKTYMMGCHRSQAVQWICQVVDALEFMHAHGIVHRDLKCENMLLNRNGHIIIIDFGTAKDLVKTDLNGPEFVGTPDFMAPEQVTGTSSMKEVEDAAKDLALSKKGSKHTTDLWALGCLTYMMHTGMTPYWSCSQYMAFLRIKRGLLTQPWGLVGDTDAWDFITSLMQLQPSERLGADAFSYEIAKGQRKVVPNKSQENPYDVIRDHPYLKKALCPDDVDGDGDEKNIASTPTSLKTRPDTPVPSLRDLCYRPIAEQCVTDANDVDINDKYPPGCGNKRHDLLMLPSERDRLAVLHVLDRQQLLKQHDRGNSPRIYARFFKTPVEARINNKLRPLTHDIVGLTQMNDDQGKSPHAVALQHDPYAEMDENDPSQQIHICQLISPILCLAKDQQATLEEEERKLLLKMFKRCIATINRQRPRLVVVTGYYVSEQCRKLLAKISESIPVVVVDSTIHVSSSGKDNNDSNDGSLAETETVESSNQQQQQQTFATFWMMGIQCLALQTPPPRSTSSQQQNDPQYTKKSLFGKQSPQMLWLREQLETVRMSKHPLFCFLPGDPRVDVTPRCLKTLARGRCLAIYGVVNMTPDETKNEKRKIEGHEEYKSKIPYVANEKLVITADDDDAGSIKSTSSDEEEKTDNFTSLVEATNQNGIRWISVSPQPDQWITRFEPIGLPP